MAACLSRVYNVLDLVVLLCNFPVASMERQMAKKTDKEEWSLLCLPGSPNLAPPIIYWND